MKRTILDEGPLDIVASLTAVPGPPAPAAVPVVAVPFTTSPSTTVASAVPPVPKTPSISVVTTSTAPSLVRPYVRRVRARPADPIPELIREIIQSQEKFSSRMTKYDKVIQIFQERFMFGLGTHEEMGFIALFSENPCMVDQFFSFNDAQRDIFVQAKKVNM